MTIGTLSKETGYTIDTIRYYEKIGILPEAKRLAGGNRIYDENDIKLLEFITCMKKAGLSLELIKNYLELHAEGNETANERVQLLEKQLEVLLKKKEELEESIKFIKYKIEINNNRK